ncbi:MAG TPA: hypothetical protein VGY77_03670, partial [Gemmataceae bacterium]|nr:hypothetical protein [Gemmataceae bacterium]
LALLVFLTGPGLALAGDTGARESSPPANRDQTWSGIFSWLNSRPKTPQPQSPAKNETGDKKKSASAAKDRDAKTGAAPVKNQVQEATNERAREQNHLLRRLDVCDQLRLIAIQKKDDNLLQQAEQLETRAWGMYTQRVATLPVGHASSEPEKLAIEKQPEPLDGDMKAKDQALEKKTGRLPAREEQ